MKPVFKSKKLNGLTKEEFNKLATNELYSYAGKVSRAAKTNEAYRIEKMAKGIRNSELAAITRMQNLEGRDMNKPERLANVSKASKLLVTCPHCGKEGKQSGMKSWHFDRCKNNPDRKPRDSKHELRR